MDESQTINKIALAVFKDKKLLLVRSHKNEMVFYSLGGKKNEGETDIDCLKREVFEEVGCEIDPASIKFLKQFEEIAHGKETTWLVIRMYGGKLIGELEPSSEIAEVGWFDSNSDPIHLSEMAQRQFMPWLKQHNYIT